MHSKWEECVGNAVKVSLGVSLPTLSYWCWECPLKIENSLFFSLSLSRCILFSPCLSIGSVCLLLLSLMCCGSHLAGHDWLLWSTLQSCVTAFGVPGHYQTHPQVHGHTSSKNIFFFLSSFLIWFVKYSGSHTLFPFLSVSFLVITPLSQQDKPLDALPRVSRQGDLTCMRSWPMHLSF